MDDNEICSAYLNCMCNFAKDIFFFLFVLY